MTDKTLCFVRFKVWLWVHHFCLRWLSCSSNRTKSYLILLVALRGLHQISAFAMQITLIRSSFTLCVSVSLSLSRSFEQWFALKLPRENYVVTLFIRSLCLKISWKRKSRKQVRKWVSKAHNATNNNENIHIDKMRKSKCVVSGRQTIKTRRNFECQL